MPFHVKKGAADPFRGDWYIQESTFITSTEATYSALKLTHQNYSDLGDSWEQFGYEWSVFEVTAEGEKKIWEGYKAISVMKGRKITIPKQEDGWIN